MFKHLSRIFLAIIIWGLFAFIIFQVPYPQSITQATFFQLLPFFITLFLALIFTLNIFLGFIFISVSISLGIIFFLILKALDSLNIVTGIITILAVGLLISYFIKFKQNGFNIKRRLTLESRIPKLKSLQRRKR